MPLSPSLYADIAAPGMSVDVGPALALTRRVEVAVSLAHSRFPVAGTDALDTGAMTAWSLATRFLFHLLPPSSTIRPYAVVGGGPYRLNRAPEQVVIVCLAHRPHFTGPCPSPYLRTRDEPEVGFGTQAGLGVSVALAPAFGAFVESTYARLLFGDALRYLPVQLGLRLRPGR